MKVEKLARRMDAWRYEGGLAADLPSFIACWLMPLPSGFAVLVSPRAGTAHGPGSKAGIVIEKGWWIIRAETGCLYAVSDAEFQKKYRPLPTMTAERVRRECERINGPEP